MFISICANILFTFPFTIRVKVKCRLSLCAELISRMKAQLIAIAALREELKIGKYSRNARSSFALPISPQSREFSQKHAKYLETHLVLTFFVFVWK